MKIFEHFPFRVNFKKQIIHMSMTSFEHVVISSEKFNMNLIHKLPLKGTLTTFFIRLCFDSNGGCAPDH